MLENIRLALSGLLSNKMRALLTMLGIIIGIGSVIAIVTVGNSLTASVSDSLVSMGGNNLQVGVTARPDENGNYSGSYGYTFDDMLNDDMLDAFKRRFESQIRAVILTDMYDSGRVQNGRLYANINLTGVNDGFFAADRVELLAGRAFREQDYEGSRRVALVSDLLVNNMFAGDAQAALGQNISLEINNSIEDFTVVGVYRYHEQGIFIGAAPVASRDTYTELYVPLSTEQELSWMGEGRYSYFELIPAPGVDSDALAARIEAFFEDRYYHSNPSLMVRAYNLQNEMSQITSVLDTISLAIGVIAGISLLVGGIGVMNIMLVSITERTREIGVRKALGAKNSAIRVQFIVEAMLICLIGGILGILVGLGLGSLGAGLMGTPAKVSLSTILLAVGFSMGIGVFFGYYPANKAAKMDPIEALRYE